MTEKVLARAAGHARVQPGDLVVCEVDRLVMIDRNFYPTPRVVCREESP